MRSRKEVEAALKRHYSEKYDGKVWALYDDSKRAYCIRGNQLPPAPEMQKLYPNGWSLMDYIKPARAQEIAKQYY